MWNFRVVLCDAADDCVSVPLWGYAVAKEVTD